MTTAAIRLKAFPASVNPVRLFKFHWKWCYGAALVLFLMMLVGYVYSINTLTAGSYALKTYQKELDTLLTQHKALDAQAATDGFLGSLQEKVMALGFQKTTDVTYVQMLNPSLAQAR